MEDRVQYFSNSGVALTTASGPAPVPSAPVEQQHSASVYPPPGTNQDKHDYEKLQHSQSPVDAPPSYSPPAPYPTAATSPGAFSGPFGSQQYPQLPPQYPPQAQSPYLGQISYGQPPPAGYPAPGFVGTPQHVGSPPARQQQQQQVLVVSAGPQYQPVAVQHVQSYVGEIVFSCFVSWCCNPLFGLIAFILAGLCIFLVSVFSTLSPLSFTVHHHYHRRIKCSFTANCRNVLRLAENQQPETMFQLPLILK